jgi:hypothetical protein
MSTINHLPDQEAGNASGHPCQESPDAAKPEAEKEKDNPAEHKVPNEICQRDKDWRCCRLLPE